MDFAIRTISFAISMRISSPQPQRRQRAVGVWLGGEAELRGESALQRERAGLPPPPSPLGRVAPGCPGTSPGDGSTGFPQIWARGSAPAHGSCATLGKSPKLSETRLPHLRTRAALCYYLFLELGGGQEEGMSLPLAEDVLCEHLEGAELGLLCSSLSGLPPRRKESCLSCSPLNPSTRPVHTGHLINAY